MVTSKSPTIARIRHEASETDARALLYIAICEVCDFFNVGKTMNDVQVALTVDLIMEQYWYLKIEEIKYCFRRAMAREKVYDRLDGNIILGWLAAYDAERTEQAIYISENADTRAQSAIAPPDPEAVGFSEYLSRLEARAASGDKDAADRLKAIREAPPAPPLTPRGASDNHDFKLWYQRYLFDKRNADN